MVCGFGKTNLCGVEVLKFNFWPLLFFLIRILLKFVCWATCLARPTSLRTTRNLTHNVPVARNFDPAPTVCFRTVSFYSMWVVNFEGYIYKQVIHSFMQCIINYYYYCTKGNKLSFSSPSLSSSVRGFFTRVFHAVLIPFFLELWRLPLLLPLLCAPSFTVVQSPLSYSTSSNNSETSVSFGTETGLNNGLPSSIPSYLFGCLSRFLFLLCLPVSLSCLCPFV
jgi:hypothetical protein